MPGDRRKAASAPLALIGIGLFLILGAGGWYLYTYLKLVATVAPPAQAEASLSDIPRVSIQDAKAAYDLGNAVFVDVRGAGSYAQSHVAGALSIPLDDLPDRSSELNPSDWIITYCTRPAEESSARAAAILKEKGFSKVTPIRGGFMAWSTAGYPVQP